jgi:hypothetical protein
VPYLPGLVKGWLTQSEKKVAQNFFNVACFIIYNTIIIKKKPFKELKWIGSPDEYIFEGI